MPAHPDSIALAVLACAGADDKKAMDPVAFDVADVLALVDVFVLVSGNTPRQVKAIGEEIERRIREDRDVRPLRREGTPESGWLLLDYGDIVCHVFTPEQREFYDLERLWADVDRFDVTTGERLVRGGSDAAGPAADVDEDGRPDPAQTFDSIVGSDG